MIVKLALYIITHYKEQFSFFGQVTNKVFSYNVIFKLLLSKCFTLNWSAPSATTHGLIPPVPRAIKAIPMNDTGLTTEKFRNS